MNDPSRAKLRALIWERYEFLVSRLTRSIGSRDLAEDALHDAFVRLERAQVDADVRQPTSYVLRMAGNIARNYRRRERRALGMDEALAYLDIPDDDQDLEIPSERRSDLGAIERAIAALPERQRRLLTAAYFDEVPTADLAKELGVTPRLVQMEIKKAIEAIRLSIASPNIVPFRGPGRRVS